MEVLLALAGIAGIAALLSQSKALPSATDTEKALDKLGKNPGDPDANTVAGKYKAFVMGDYEAAMPYLAQGGDKTLKTLAEHELDAGYTLKPTDKVVMGDEWVAAAKKFPVISKILYDRASQWYVRAWPELDAAWKVKAREQGRKLASSRPPGVFRKAVPTGWLQDPGISGNPAELDGAISRTGSYSMKVIPGQKNVNGSASAFRSIFIPISGDVIEAVSYVRSDGTENGADAVYLLLFDGNNRLILAPQTFIPIDTPFWNRVVIKARIPKDATRVQFQAANNSRGGVLWVDDVSVKVDGKEILNNNSFETP